MFGISNPQALLRPWRSLTQFSEELYAMMTSRAPVDREGPVTIRVREGQTALKLTRAGVTEPGVPPIPPRARENAVEGPRPRPESRPRAADRPARVPPPADHPAARVPPPPPPPPGASAPAADRAGRDRQSVRSIPEGPRPERRRDEDAARRRSEARPVLEVEGPARFSGGEPARFEVPPQVYDRKRAEWVEIPYPKLDDPDFPVPIPSGGTNVFVGKVQSHDPGQPAQIVLYPDGPEADPRPAQAVPVKIPTLADGEALDPDTWVFGIFRFSDPDGNPIYYAQPPIWLR